MVAAFFPPLAIITCLRCSLAPGLARGGLPDYFHIGGSVNLGSSRLPTDAARLRKGGGSEQPFLGSEPRLVLSVIGQSYTKLRCGSHSQHLTESSTIETQTGCQ